MCNSRHPRSYLRMLIASIKPAWFMDQEQADRLFPLSTWFSRMMRESGYFHLQATKPDTLGLFPYYLENTEFYKSTHFANFEN